MLWWAEYGCDPFSRQISLHLFLLCFFSKFYKAFLVVITLQNILSVLEKPLSWLSSQTTVAGGTEVSFWWAISLSLTPFLLFFYLQFIFVCLCFEAIIQLKTNSQSLFICSFSSVQFSSVAQSCPTLCNPMNCSTPGLPVHHQLPEITQTHVHRVSDAIQPSHPLSSPPPPAPNPSQHPGLFQGVNSSHEVAKVLEFQLQHQSFQWTFRTDLL